MRRLTQEEVSLLKHFSDTEFSACPRDQRIETERLACRGLLVRLGKVEPIPGPGSWIDGVQLSRDSANLVPLQLDAMRQRTHDCVYRISRRGIKMLRVATGQVFVSRAARRAAKKSRVSKPEQPVSHDYTAIVGDITPIDPSTYTL